MKIATNMNISSALRATHCMRWRGAQPNAFHPMLTETGGGTGCVYIDTTTVMIG